MKYKAPKPMFGKQKEINITKLESSKPITESWNEFKKAIPLTVNTEIFALLKQSYFAGAFSLYGSLMMGLDPSTNDETPMDLLKMERIHNELFEFKDNMKKFLEDAFIECEDRKKVQ